MEIIILLGIHSLKTYSKCINSNNSIAFNGWNPISVAQLKPVRTFVPLGWLFGAVIIHDENEIGQNAVSINRVCMRSSKSKSTNQPTH